MIAFMSRLTEHEVAALHEALDDEYKAHATYEAVIRDFGPVRPFVNIVESEGRHIEALLRLFERYDLPVPANPYRDEPPRFDSLADACAAGVQGEIDNGELYDRLLAASERPDIRHVLSRLQEASQQRHLPAFQRCLARERDR
jgi:hypothetical protein